MKSILSTDWTPYLRQSARAVAVAVAALIVVAEFTYHAGRMTGAAVHRLNDTAAGIISGRVDWRPMLIELTAWAHSALAAPHAAPVAPVRLVVQRQAPAAPAIGLQRPSLAALPVKQLRVMAREAGHKTLARSGRRVDLMAALGVTH